LAITRLGHIKENKGGKNPNQGIKNCINYIINPFKTENFKYISGNNVILTSNSQKIVAEGYQQFMNTKNTFGKPLGRQAYHYKLSFAKQDNVSPELAMQITQEFCEIYLADYESIYAVHTNTKHIHSHICFNSVDMSTGRKYYYKNGDWKKYIQPVVNALCTKYNLSYIELNPSEDIKFSNKDNKQIQEKKKYGHYGQWINDKSDNEKKEKAKKPYYTYAMIRKDIDEAAYQVSSYKEFKAVMIEKGYKIEDKNKYIGILAPGRTKLVRTHQLTPDKNTYTTVIGKRGKSKHSLLVLTERKTRKEIIHLLEEHTARAVVDKLDLMERRMGDMFYKIFKSITVDNGTEFSYFSEMERSALNDKLRTKLFYCHPYSSYERGTNENTNKMIRRHIPKSTNFDDKTDEDIQFIEDWINNYPRRMHGFCSANDLYNQEINKILQAG